MRKGDKLGYLIPSLVDTSFLRFPIFFMLYDSNWKRADLPNIFCTFRNLGRNSIFQSIRSGLRQNSNNLILDSSKYNTKRIHWHLKIKTDPYRYVFLKKMGNITISRIYVKYFKSFLRPIGLRPVEVFARTKELSHLFPQLMMRNPSWFLISLSGLVLELK